MKPAKLFLTFVSCLLAFSCFQKEESFAVVVTNTLDLDRQFETVEISKSFLGIESLNSFGIIDVESGDTLVSQLVDENGDDIIDLLLFQPEIKANSEKTFQLISIPEDSTTSEEKICYSRFVPERTDDYTWENNKVAFRTFGPNAQYRFENKLKEATLTSGIDAWLKRVEYSIIDKWYKKYTDKTGSYHKDTGEGLDNFHVGKSRGVGGIAFKKDSIYYTSKNFINYKTICNGPIRTSFILDYGTWDANGTMITESKKISLDYGNNLSKIELSINGVDTISAGLTLHEKDGVVTSHKDETWLNYWQPHADSKLGTAIVTSSLFHIDSEKYETDKKDLSHAFMHLKVINGITVYYSGFTWQKSEQFKNQYEWEKYLSDFSKKVDDPLRLSMALKKTFIEAN